jgi:anthranilate phosphoribosyltransferase
LISPVQRDYLVIGVHEERLGQVFAEALKTLKAKRAWVVHCKSNGLDAISPEGETLVWQLEKGDVTTRTISPATFGCQEHPLSHVQLPSNGSASGSVASSYSAHGKIIDSLLSPRRARAGQPIIGPYEPDAYGTANTVDTAAIEDYVCLNAAALVFVAGKAASEKDAFEAARRSLKEGKAYHALEALRDAAALSVDTDDRQLEGSDNEL